MRFLYFLPLLFLAACGQQGNAEQRGADKADAVYHRVMASGVIRCGYSVWPPLFTLDPNTGAKGGIFGDIAEEIGRRYGLKIEWAEEIGWGSVPAALEGKRVDAACAAYWQNTNRARSAYFTAPVFYSVNEIWQRGSDTRTFASMDDLNSPAHSFGYIDGSAESKVIGTRFPLAKTVTLPELASSGEQFEMLAGGKVDFIVMDPPSVMDFLAKKPGVLKPVFPGQPVTLYPNVMMLPGGEGRLKNMFDTAIMEMRFDGTLDAILKKHNATGMYRAVGY